PPGGPGPSDRSHPTSSAPHRIAAGSQPCGRVRAITDEGCHAPPTSDGRGWSARCEVAGPPSRLPAREHRRPALQERRDRLAVVVAGHHLALGPAFAVELLGER